MKLLLFVDCLDGRGDFEHFKAYALYLKKTFPDLKLIGIVGVWRNNVSACKAVINFLKSERSLFEDILVSVDELGGSKRILSADEDAEIRNKLIIPFRLNISSFLLRNSSVNAGLGISVADLKFSGDSRILEWVNDLKRRGIPVISFGEYGSCNREPNSYNMGLSQNLLKLPRGNFQPGDRSAVVGIRMIEEWRGPITVEQKISALLNFSNKKFLNALVNPNDLLSEVTTTEVSWYLEKRKIFPAYLSGELSVALFIMLQVSINQNNSYGLDFYVPAKSINQSVLMELLQKFGIGAENCVFYDDLSKTHNIEKDFNIPRVRIFSSLISLEDSDFKTLYYIAGGSVGACGDDSITTAFSTENLPFILHATHWCKQDFFRQMQQIASALNLELFAEYLRKLNDPVTVALEGTEIRNVNFNYNLSVSRDCFDTDNQRYAENIPYRAFQQALIEELARQAGQFIMKNYEGIFAEFLIFREALYEHCNVFEKIPNILRPIINRPLNTQEEIFRGETPATLPLRFMSFSATGNPMSEQQEKLAKLDLK